MKYYPVMLNVSGIRAAVVGGGDVAYRKVKDLLDRGALVTVIAPQICEPIKSLQMEHPGCLSLAEKPYSAGDLDGAALVFSAANDRSVNAAVFRDAKKSNIFINAVDDPEHCSFITPSWFQRGELMVSVSTGGASPAMSAKIRRLIEDAIPGEIEAVLESLKLIRSLLQDDVDFAAMGTKERGEVMKRIVQDDRLTEEMVASHQRGELKNFLIHLVR